MRSLAFRSFIVVGIAASAAPAAASTTSERTHAPAIKAGTIHYVATQCMVDDGQGRLRPCSSLYKQQHPDWRYGRECMVDDGQGRLRPCSSLAKPKKN
jgi:hypothetical protein